MTKEFRPARLYKDDYNKIQELSNKLTAIENRKITTPEIIRRTLRINGIEPTLFEDAELKRRLRNVR